MRAAPFERRRATAAGRGVHLAAAAAVVHGHSPSALFFSLLSLFLHRYLWSLSSSFPALPADWRHVVGRATEGEARTAATGGEVGRRIRPVRAARARGAAVEVHRFPLHGYEMAAGCCRCVAWDPQALTLGPFLVFFAFID